MVRPQIPQLIISHHLHCCDSSLLAQRKPQASIQYWGQLNFPTFSKLLFIGEYLALSVKGHPRIVNETHSAEKKIYLFIFIYIVYRISQCLCLVLSLYTYKVFFIKPVKPVYSLGPKRKNWPEIKILWHIYRRNYSSLIQYIGSASLYPE